MIFLVLVFLFPLAVYSLLLAVYNRGPTAHLVSGRWDFAGVLFAVSGFLLFGGPAVLSGLYEQARLAGIVDPARSSAFSFLYRPLGQLPWIVWVSVWILYFVAVVGGAALLLWRRRHTLVIYNITPAEFRAVLPRVLDGFGLDWVWSGQLVFINPAAAEKDGPTPALTPGGEDATGPAAWRVEAFPALRHVTLRWVGTPHPLHADIEAELERTLEQFPTSHSSLSSWFLGVAGGLFFVVFVGLLGFVVALIRLLAR